MKTERLIAELAADCRPIRRGAVERSLLGGLVLGGAIALVGVTLWLGLRPFGEAATSAPFWMKAAYTLALAGAGWSATRSLARPDGRLGAAPLAAALAFAAIVALALLELRTADPAAAKAALLGHTWRVCPVRIFALGLPLLLLTLLALRKQAPTRLGLAGATAGLLTGGLAATIYGLHCTEPSAAFTATWYSLGVLTTVAAGAGLGRLLLRW